MSCRRLSLSRRKSPKGATFFDWCCCAPSSPPQRTTDDRKRKDGIRARREIETSTALNRSSRPEKSNRSSSPYGAKHHSAHGEAPLRDIRTDGTSISFERFRSQHHAEPNLHGLVQRSNNGPYMCHDTRPSNTMMIDRSTALSPLRFCSEDCATDSGSEHEASPAGIRRMPSAFRILPPTTRAAFAALALTSLAQTALVADRLHSVQIRRHHSGPGFAHPQRRIGLRPASACQGDRARHPAAARHHRRACRLRTPPRADVPRQRQLRRLWLRQPHGWRLALRPRRPRSDGAMFDLWRG